MKRLLEFLKNQLNDDYQGDLVKLLITSNVLCWLLTFETQSIGKNALSLCVQLMIHPFPKVRRAAADDTYTRFLVDEKLFSQFVSEKSSDENEQEKFTNILLTTVWDRTSEVDQSLEDSVSKMCQLLGIEKPQKRQTTQPTRSTPNGKQQQQQRDSDSYGNYIDQLNRL